MGRYSVSNAKVMTITLAPASKRINGLSKCCQNRPMLNGFLVMLRSVHGVRRQLKGLWDVTLCPALVAKTFAICVRSLGSPIIRIILSVIYIRSVLMRL